MGVDSSGSDARADDQNEVAVEIIRFLRVGLRGTYVHTA